MPVLHDDKSPRKLSGIVWGICVAAILSSVFLFALDNTIVALVQPKILESFGEIEKLPWVSVSFALGSVAMNLLWGKLFGQFNGKKLFIAAVLLFEIGSAICGAAPTMNAFIVGRAICGVGGTGIYMGAMNLISVSTSTIERPLYLGFIGFTWGSGTVLGPIIGGAFSDSSATWRWAFYINLCIGALAAPAYFFLLPSHDPMPGVSVSKRASNIDYAGTILIIGAQVSGVMAISFGGSVYAWNSGQIIGCFVCAIVLWILFSLQQGYSIFTTPERRLFPGDLVRNWELDILFAQTAAAISCAFIPIYFIPLFFQFVRGDSALQAGVRLLPFVFLMVFATIMNGAIMSKFGYYMPWFLGGGILVVIGSALMYTITIDSSASQIYGYGILIGIGAGSYSQATFSVAQAKVPASRVAEATAFIGFAQMTGITLALSIATSVFLNKAVQGIQEVAPDTPLDVIHGAVQGAGSSFFESLSSADRIAVLQAIVHSLNDAYVLVMAGGALTVVLAICMKRERLFLEATGGGA
ncbi:major facilitator superfamily-domain-containing protein [Truncatella angustata]|uniref:Major facilitator superfamily-domain-containing protein n=1 Tax=Truncatella angustata TaxID=152316 RepID=A0A9P8UPV3_9PEZI|nr:major facilitator superfamily-domain-containing protein [Truncatella angustata]KAH6656000.1 major facilitator superfamily-domain-containing protein [Truncatella angustata]